MADIAKIRKLRAQRLSVQDAKKTAARRSKQVRNERKLAELTKLAEAVKAGSEPMDTVEFQRRLKKIDSI